jgi:hypothetical protein
LRVLLAVVRAQERLAVLRSSTLRHRVGLWLTSRRAATRAAIPSPLERQRRHPPAAAPKARVRDTRWRLR